MNEARGPDLQFRAGKVKVKKVEVIESDRVANLANLRRELKLAEGTGSVESENRSLRQARETLISRIESFQNSRYQLGRAIAAYKSFFKQEGSWTRAAKLIADYIGTSERTVHRIMEEYESASHLPEITLDAMMEQKIDPAAGKNADLVENLLEMPAPETRDEARAAVRVVSQAHLEKKRLARKPIAKFSGTDDLDQFAQRVVRQFAERYRTATPEHRDAEVRYVLEMIVSSLRADIRELRQFARPALVPRPEAKDAA